MYKKILLSLIISLGLISCQNDELEDSSTENIPSFETISLDSAAIIANC